MNPFSAFIKVLELIPDGLGDVIQRSETMEEKLQSASNEISTYKTKADNLLDNTMDWISTFLSNSELKGMVTNSDLYQKLKGQDVSSLVQPFEGIDINDSTQLQAAITTFIGNLKTFCKPLEIQNADTIFPLIQEIVTDLFQLPASMGTNEQNAIAALQSSNIEALRPKVVQLIQLLLNITLSEPSPTKTGQPPKTPNERFLSDLETNMPTWESEISGAEGLETKIEDIIGILKKMLPLLSPVIAQYTNGHIIDQAKIDAFLTEASTELQGSDLNNADEVLNEVVNVVAKLLAKQNITADSPFHFLIEIIQKIKYVANFLLGNGILMKLKLHHLAANESFPHKVGLNLPPRPANVPAAPQHDPQQNGGATKGDADTAGSGGTTQNSTQQSVEEDGFGGVVGRLIAEAIADLSLAHQTTAKGILDGSIFEQNIIDLQTLEGSLKTEVQTEWAKVVQALQTGSSETLSGAFQLLINLVKKVINAVLTDLKTALSNLIQTVSSILQLIVDVLLAIKIPEEVINVLDSSLDKSVNLICLILAIPVEAYVKISSLSSSDIEGWINKKPKTIPTN